MEPMSSVSFVENHDTQKLQALESAVKDWFKPIAYTIILMSENAYPCVFYPDLFGVEYVEIQDNKEIKIVMPKVSILTRLLEARKRFAYGEQISYFDHPDHSVAQEGDEVHQKCIVMISNNEEGNKEMKWILP
jgi:alpha-amylase